MNNAILERAANAASREATKQGMDVHHGQLFVCVRAALAAVIPAIQAEALEWAAVTAEAFPLRTHGGLATDPYASAEQAADEIAAAIRAMKEPTP
jgi:hypothetical protein